MCIISTFFSESVQSSMNGIYVSYAYPCPSAVSMQYICSVSAVSTACALDRPAVHEGYHLKSTMYFVLKYPLKCSEVCFEVQRSAYFAALGLHCRRTRDRPFYLLRNSLICLEWGSQAYTRKGCTPVNFFLPTMRTPHSFVICSCIYMHFY